PSDAHGHYDPHLAACGRTPLERLGILLIHSVTLLIQRYLAYQSPIRTVTLLIQRPMKRRQRRAGEAGHWVRWVSALWRCSLRIRKASVPRKSASISRQSAGWAIRSKAYGSARGCAPRGKGATCAILWRRGSGL